MTKQGSDIKYAKQVLEEGGLVGIPTETVYGLAANALDHAAVVKIFEAKNRPSFDPLILHVGSVGEFENYAKVIPKNAMRLAEKVCPGPISFVFKKKKAVPDLVTSGHPTVALRVPNHPLTLKLLKGLNFPLAAPSANPFGFTSPTTAQHVLEQLHDQVGYVLDGGECQVGLESTIIDFSNQKPIVLRLGGLSLEFLEEELHTQMAVKTSSSNPNAPGMLSAHYNPGKPIVIGDIDLELKLRTDQNVGVLAFRKKRVGVSNAFQRVLSPTGDVAEAAQNFFRMLREFNKLNVDVVLAEWLPEEGLGRAINDRLKRAAASRPS